MTFSRLVIIKDSITINKLAYDWRSRTLRVWFVSTGSVWDFKNVYAADFAKLASASSVGECFNTRFRDRYECERVEENVDTTKTPKPKVQGESARQQEEVGIKAKKIMVSKTPECKGSGYPNCCNDHREIYYNTPG